MSPGLTGKASGFIFLPVASIYSKQVPSCQKNENESLRPLLFMVNRYLQIVNAGIKSFLACLFLYIRKRCMKTNQKTKGLSKPAAKRSPETLEERVHRHLSDINSKITDDDIRSVKTELDIRRGATTRQTQNKASKKQKRSIHGDKKENKQTNEPKHTTPWDLLSEGYE